LNPSPFDPKPCVRKSPCLEENDRSLQIECHQPRTPSRGIDIDPGLAELLKQHIGVKKAGRVFEARNGSPISGNNVLKRVLHPLLERLEIPKAGLHASRHSRVTMLRKNGTPEDLQKQWIGAFFFANNRQVFTHSSRT
jgi:integrase